jgi:hypothetical protein
LAVRVVDDYGGRLGDAVEANMRVGRTIAIVAAVVGILTTATPAAASPGWIVTCPHSHFSHDDPIVHPGEPGAAHEHEFIGNRTVDAHSTYDGSVGQPTTCPKNDSAGYWLPSFYEGTRRMTSGYSATGRFTRNTVYYRNNLNGYVPWAIKAPPEGLKIVVGKAKATSVAKNPKLGSELYYGCSDNSTDKLTKPRSCSTHLISVHIGFPNCWNGVDLDSPNHRSHMAWPKENSSGRYVCPKSHPVPIVRIIMRLEFETGAKTSNFRLSSGPTYTLHGDFFNTWVQADLRKLTKECIWRSVDCGTFEKTSAVRAHRDGSHAGSDHGLQRL